MDKEKKVVLIISIVFIILLFFLVFIYIDKKNNEKVEKKDGILNLEIDTKSYNSFDKFIKNLSDESTKDKKSKFNYSYEKKDGIISILTVIDAYDSKTKSYIRKYRGYNLYEDSGIYIDAEKMAELYNKNIDDILDKVNNQIKKYYQEESNLGLFDKNECDYNCYLEAVRKIDSIYSTISLVFVEGKLYAYFDLNVLNDKEYFESLNYNPYRIVIE